VDQAPSGADLFPTVVSGHLPVPVASTAAFAAASPSQLPSALKLEYSTRWPRSWYLLEGVAPLGSWCKLLHQPPAMSNHIYMSSVCSSDRGFTSPPSTDALRGIRLGASIHDASAFPPPATPSTPSPWTTSSCCSMLPGLLCNSVFFGGPICNMDAVTL
jgi:hypothetical protein